MDSLIFLDFIRKHQDPKTWLEIRAIKQIHGLKPRSEVRHKMFVDINEADEWASKMNRDGYNVYLGGSGRNHDGEQRENGKRRAGRAQDCPETSVIWFDLDVKSSNHPNAKFESIEDAVKQLYPKPTVLVSSGGGIQAWYRLNRVWDWPDLTPWVRAIQVRFGGDATHDASRVMRLPGYVNQKNKAVARIIDSDFTRVYDIKDFEVEPLLDTIKAKKIRKETREATEHDLKPLLLTTIHAEPRGSSYRCKCPMHRGDTVDSMIFTPTGGYCFSERRSYSYADLISKDKCISKSQAIKLLFELYTGAKALPEEMSSLWQHELTRDKHGVLDNELNLMRIMRNDPFFKDFGYSEFLGQNTRNRKEINETTYVTATEYINVKYMPKASFLRVQRCLERWCREQTYDELNEYVAGLTWDGTKRIEYLPDMVLGGEDVGEYEREGVKIWLCGMIARALTPGIKFDLTLALAGEGGRGKTWVLEKFAGPWYRTLNQHDVQREGALSVLGSWMIILDEGTDEVSQSLIKSWLTKREDKFKPPYGRNTINVKRRLVVGVTTNHDWIALDEASCRRYVMIRVGENIDLAYIDANRDQIFAEAKFLLENGQKLHFDGRFKDEQLKALKPDRRRISFSVPAPTQNQHRKQWS
jgi:hypothetical protein